MKQGIKKPKYRSKFRLKCGMAYYGLMRILIWSAMSSKFAKNYDEPLPYLQYNHKTTLLRKLRNVDMQYQHNKIVNLKIAVKKLNRLIIRPGEVFSYWRLIGNPTKRKGYIDGMVLNNGTFGLGVGGGLCQMSNLIYWMAIHTPLTVVERHRHGYDVFPDSNRTQPFGSGATCFYPHGDLMIRNDTNDDYQLIVEVGNEFLMGELRMNISPKYRYEIVEKEHEVRTEYWGGYSRHNKLYKQIFDLEGNFIDEEFVIANSALMMYSPFLSKDSSSSK